MMFDEEDYSSESDDVDYVPSDHEGISEEENSGDEEDVDALKAEAGEDGVVTDSRRKRVKKKKKQNSFTRQRTGGIKLQGEEIKENNNDDLALENEANKQLADQIKQEEEQKKVEKEKKKADDLWSSFLSDVGTPKRPTPSKSSSSSSTPSLASLSSLSKPVSSTEKVKKEATPSTPTSSQPQKVTITKVYDFAGESVQITKEVDADSKEAKALNRDEECDKKHVESPVQKPSVLSTIGVKRPSVGGGLGSVLNKINKKPKIGTLEKSRLDWTSFKDQEGISEELQIHNRGKEGFIQRQQFLERTDVRQFEIEKNLRQTASKR